MMNFSPKHRIYLAIGAIDFRCGIDSLARICQYQFQQAPRSGHYFIFRNKAKTSLKIIYYDGQGFCLFQKRLSQGQFSHWPKNPYELILMSSIDMQVLLHNGEPQKINCAPDFSSI